MLRKVYAFFILATIVSCGSTTPKQEGLTIESTPVAANVWKENELLGKTPLQLPADTDAPMGLRVSHPGHYDSFIYVGPKDFQKISVNLKKIRPDDFKELIRTELHGQMNELVNRLLETHGMLVSGQTDKANAEIDKLINEYPNVAAVYTMKANILAEQGKLQDAYANALMALKMNRQDVTAARLVEYLQGRLTQ